MPTNQPILDRFAKLKAKVLEHPRIAGVYMIEAALIPTDSRDDVRREQFLRSFASSLGFSEPDVGDEEWKHAEVFRDDAREKIILALTGGAEIGHSRWDVPPAKAAEIADEFLDLFTEDARFFCSVPPAGRAQVLGPYDHRDFGEYIFNDGCVTMDHNLVAVIWAFDND